MTDDKTLPRSYAKADPELRFSFDFLTGSDVKIGEREMPDAEARFAMELLRTNGILCGSPDGEDSGGRAKMTNMPVADLVARAFDVATETYSQARKRGCMLMLPSDDEIKAKVDEAKEAAEADKEARRIAREERRKESADAQV